MDRMILGNETLIAQRPRVDRFVAPRDSLPEIRRRCLWSRCERVGDIWYAKYLQQKKYENYFNEAFGLETMKVQESKNSEPQDNKLESWPCIPRKKRYLSSADSILDLPTYSFADFPELVDWSKDNILVAALGRRYHKWSWWTHDLIDHGFAQNDIHCCKFDPRGELLLLGTTMKTVEIHDKARSKRLSSNDCQCLKVNNEYCSITAIDWSPTGNSFVTGCSRGILCSITRQSQVIKRRKVFQGATLVVKVSPNARYVAAASLNEHLVLVLTWPGLEQHSNCGSDWTIKALTWHPWRSALLGIGTVTPKLHANIALWNVPTAKIRKAKLSNNVYSLDTMLFSHITGELVLSLWNTERATTFPKFGSQLVVMSDADTVVDQWGEGRTGLDRVRTMVFSPDGTKLATATADEDLIIWNFLPEDHNKKKKKKCKSFSAMPAYLDEASYGFSLR